MHLFFGKERTGLNLSEMKKRRFARFSKIILLKSDISLMPDRSVQRIPRICKYLFIFEILFLFYKQGPKGCPPSLHVFLDLLC